MNCCQLGFLFALDCFKALKFLWIYRMRTENTAQEGRIKPLLKLA